MSNGTWQFGQIAGGLMALWLGACGGGAAPEAAGTDPAPEPPVTSEPATSEPAPEEPAAEVPWKDMNHEQQVAHMKEVVMPAMSKTFQEFDAEHYAEMNCATCHGPGAKDGEFHMPNAALPALDPKDSFAAHKEKHGKTLQFMMEKVTPQMAGLLGMEPYNPETKSGFGCFGCHTMKK